MSKQVIIGGDPLNTLNTGTAYYYNLFGRSARNTTETSNTNIVPVAGTLHTLRIKLDIAPGSGKSFTFTLRKNGGNTALSVTISDSATTGVDTDSVSVAAGDTLDIYVSPSNTPTASHYSHSVVFEPTINGKTFVSGHCTSLSSPGGYTPLSSRGSYESTSYSLYLVIPCDGTLRNSFVKLTAAPGAGKSWAVYVFRDSDVGNFSFTISDTDTTGSNTADSLSVSAGEKIYMYLLGTNSPATTRVTAGLEFTPNVSGNFILPTHGGSTSLINSSSTYNMPVCIYPSSSDDTYDRMVAAIDFTIKKWYIALSTSPGSGKSWSCDIYKDGSPQTITLTISDDALDGNATKDISVLAGETLSCSVTPSNTPNFNTKYNHGILGFISDYKYTRGNYATLPTDDADLETYYTEDEISKVGLDNGVFVEQTATSEYAIHQFRDSAVGASSGTFTCKWKSNLAPFLSIVKLQIYKFSNNTWEDLDSDNTATENEVVTLQGVKADLTNYKSGSDEVVCRAWQLDT